MDTFRGLYNAVSSYFRMNRWNPNTLGWTTKWEIGNEEQNRSPKAKMWARMALGVLLVVVAVITIGQANLRYDLAGWFDRQLAAIRGRATNTTAEGKVVPKAKRMTSRRNVFEPKPLPKKVIKNSLDGFTEKCSSRP